MFNGGEFSKILDGIFEKDDKEKEKAIKIYCKTWKYLENITLQNLKYKRAFEILKDNLQFENLGEMQSGIVFRGYFEDCFNEDEKELLEELMKDENNRLN